MKPVFSLPATTELLDLHGTKFKVNDKWSTLDCTATTRTDDGLQLSIYFRPLTEAELCSVWDGDGTPAPAETVPQAIERLCSKFIDKDKEPERFEKAVRGIESEIGSRRYPLRDAFLAKGTSSLEVNAALAEFEEWLWKNRHVVL